MRRERGRVVLMAAALVGLVASGAGAEVTTEKSASILVFPKVIADGTRDTIIQITNTSNSMAHAHCFYVNGALTFPELPAGPLNPPLCTEIDFDIWLTTQQPTYWVVSKGRLENPLDPPCYNPTPQDPDGFYACNEAGIDPGRVPPVVEDFTGELKCIEVDASGAPLPGNHFKGEATIITLDVCNPDTSRCEVTGEACDPTSTADQCDSDDSDAAKYNGIGVLGNENNDADGVLCLGGEPTEECPQGAEYNACPQYWILNHFAEGAPDPVAGDGSSVRTEVTIVPCTENFETQEPETVTIFIERWNEFEQPISASLRMACWESVFLGDINPVAFDFATMGTAFGQTRMRPTSQTRSGFMVVGQEYHTAAPGPRITYTQSGAVNYHIEDERPGPDLITIPAEQLLN